MFIQNLIQITPSYGLQVVQIERVMFDFPCLSSAEDKNYMHFLTPIPNRAHKRVDKQRNKIVKFKQYMHAEQHTAGL